MSTVVLRRSLNIQLINDLVFDDRFDTEIVKVLREYADKVERYEMGCTGDIEHFTSEGGTVLIASSCDSPVGLFEEGLEDWKIELAIAALPETGIKEDMS